jgi:hypothetical protein
MGGSVNNWRPRLIASGIRNLKEFGYPAVTEQNILTDAIYSTFFERMLKDNKGHSEAADQAIDGLLDDIASAR